MSQSELDGALLTAIVDATIRVGRTDLLYPWVRKQQSNFQRVKRAHTFSSIEALLVAMEDCCIDAELCTPIYGQTCGQIEIQQPSHGQGRMGCIQWMVVFGGKMKMLEVCM
jgi:hypothetical protein